MNIFRPYGACADHIWSQQRLQERSWLGYGNTWCQLYKFYKTKKIKVQTIQNPKFKLDHCFRWSSHLFDFYINIYPTCIEQAHNKLLHMTDNSSFFSITQFTKDLKKSVVSGLLMIFSVHSMWFTPMLISKLV